MSQPAFQFVKSSVSAAVHAPREYGEKYTPNAPTIGEAWCCICGSVPFCPCAPLLSYNAAGMNWDALIWYCLVPCLAVYKDFERPE